MLHLHAIQKITRYQNKSNTSQNQRFYYKDRNTALQKTSLINKYDLSSGIYGKYKNYHSFSLKEETWHIILSKFFLLIVQRLWLFYNKENRIRKIESYDIVNFGKSLAAVFNGVVFGILHVVFYRVHIC